MWHRAAALSTKVASPVGGRPPESRRAALIIDMLVERPLLTSIRLTMLNRIF